MMDRVQVARALRNLLNSDFDKEVLTEQERAIVVWERLCHEDSSLEALNTRCKNKLSLSWDDQATAIYPVSPPGSVPQYTICGIDGSQVYPDRHTGISFLLIQIGGALFSYSEKSSVSFFVHPEIIPTQKASEWKDLAALDPTVRTDLLRDERELARGLALGREHRSALMLFDGSLAWLTRGREGDERSACRARIEKLLVQFEQENIPYASYVSAPHSRDLVRLIQKVLNTPEEFVSVFDTDILIGYLEYGKRTPFFTTHAHFASCYMHTGTEIARLELPVWLIRNTKLTDFFCTVILDQCNKGNGYPRCLAEAHDQAVVTEADRSFFRLLVEKEHANRGKIGPHTSQKSFLKIVNGI